MADKKHLFEKRADIVVPNLTRSGGLSAAELLASRDSFDQFRRQLASSGGRPTNPNWTIKRGIPLSAKTWDTLKQLADRSAASGTKIAPAQLAGFLLEDAIRGSAGRLSAKPTRSRARRRRQHVSIGHRRTDWQMPSLFSGSERHIQ